MESDTIRVAHIIGDMSGGGVEAVVMNYYRYIDRTKIQFDFIVHDTSTHVPQQEIEDMGGKIFYVPHYKKLSAYQKSLLKIFRENKYSIVHSHMNTLSVFPLKVAKKAGVKVRIAHSHSTSNKKEWKRNIIKNLLRPYSKKYATHYFACSEYAGRWLFGNRTYERGLVTVVNNAIDIDRFKFDNTKRDYIRAELGVEDKFVIGHVGRFMSQKNHGFLIDIFNEVQKRRQNAVLLLLGDGPLLPDIKEKVAQYGISDKVVFTGLTGSPEIYYNAMDCFVLPSLYEGLGMVCVEAQVNGLICIVSTEVPKETKVCERIEYVPLQCVEQWIDRISFLQKTDREEIDVTFEKYDIRKNAPELEFFYKTNV